MKLSRALVVFLIYVGMAAPALAAEPPVSLHRGMSYDEVRKAKGEPLEKDVHESDRVVLWRYADITLRFTNGRLTGQSALHPKPVVGAEPTPLSTPPSHSLKHEMSQKDVDDILNQIPNEGPETASTPVPNGGSPFQTGQAVPQPLEDQ